MAKTFALSRSATQPITVDTTLVATNTLGTSIAGLQTGAQFPARCVNLFTVLGGDPYFLGLTAVGDIVVYRLIAGVWSAVGGPFTPAVGHVLTPTCLHVVNDQLVAIWSDEAGAADGMSAATSFDGTTWTAPDPALAVIGASNGGHSILYRGTIWFATSIGLWAYAPSARFMTLVGIVGAFVEGETVTGGTSLTTAVVRSYNSPILRVDTVSGSGFLPGEVISSGSGSGTLSTITRFVNALPDTGNDTFLGTAGAGTANLVGAFASWDGALYFLQPKTASNPIRLYQLATNWESTANVPTPQWSRVSFSGVVDAGFATVGTDSGMWCLFVNKADELCMFYSGSGSTKLAKTTSKVTPLVFTDLSNSLLPQSVSSRTNVGVTLYTDDRRRDNILQWFFIRDLSGASTFITSWDGSGSVVEVGSFVGVDTLLPFSYMGFETTFTDLQPTATVDGDSQPFPGRVRIDYTLRASPARTLGIIAEYSIDGDRYFPMTQGSADSGVDDLPANSAGIPYFFHWDVFADLDGDLDNVLLRIVARITGV